VTELFPTNRAFTLTGQTAPQVFKQPSRLEELTRSEIIARANGQILTESLIFFGFLSLILGVSPMCDRLPLLREGMVAAGAILAFIGSWRLIARWVFN